MVASGGGTGNGDGGRGGASPPPGPGRGGGGSGEIGGRGVGVGGGGVSDVGTGGASSPGLVLSCPRAAVGHPVLRLLNRFELERTWNDIFPEAQGQWTNSLPAVTASDLGFDNDAAAQMGTQLADALLVTATSAATAITGTALAGILPCASAAADRACADGFLTKYGRRLFRRPLTAADHDRYLVFFDASRAKADFKTALKWMTVGLLQSPNGIYRREIGTPGSDGMRALTPYEVATELAYTFTGSTPTEELLTQAAGAGFTNAVTTAKALLATPAGKQALHHFFETWLGYQRAGTVEKSNIPQFPSVRTAMVQETRAFIDEVVFQKGQGLKELLTAPTTNLSAALAQYYGYPAPSIDFGSTARPPGRGIGILAQGSILASRAKPDSSSPTERGLLVLQRLLCQPKPVLPNVVPPIPGPNPGKVTTRARYETLHATGGCAACHKQFDPIGFGFEHFDAGGRYRADEDGLPIDSASAVPGPGGQPSLFSFRDEESLATGLAAQPMSHQCLAAYLATYAFGTTDACLGSSKVNDLQAGAIGILDAFSALAAEPHFTRRLAQ